MSTPIPLIIRSLQSHLEIGNNAEIEEIQRMFKDYFSAEDAEWTDECWLDK
jgi:hypothetical protein